MHKEIINSLIDLKNDDRAAFLQHFFRTEKGGYGEGDMFLGLTVPQVRAIAKNNTKASLSDIKVLLNNEWHEIRLCGVILLVYKFPKSDLTEKKQIYNLYFKSIGKGINNWDIVDVSCAHIVGAWLFDKPRDDLYLLSQGGLWQKRTSIISTFYFLRKGDVSDTFALAEILVIEQHDLLQKAVGWSLREMGKVDDTLLYSFLDKHAATMPRTMLRYSLEKLSITKKNYYMNLKNNKGL